MEQREVDNMLLSMIQKHFPSLPLSDEYTDWGKWLGFARAVYEAGRASPVGVPAWTHSCNALCIDGLELWIPQCPHCGKPAPTPPVSEDRKDAERYRWLRDNKFKHNGHSLVLTGPILWDETLDQAIDTAMKEKT